MKISAGCDVPYNEHIEQSVADASEELIEICGGSDNLPCLVEGVCGTEEDALIYLEDVGDS